ncbi:uncharacterized protein N7483_001471 [Penicillium malachiteum]|uniref:uncharacterized protein n=1 Tax=Penicillium malachiteum TaxID=1324776 RepID=UPI002549B863|nr:uncharacterized protein N7483_001471 [Penicillium malachiteum]KAJ5736346.1 hypothetical protein N7483_001471 [Penicillium malachiteum]
MASEGAPEQNVPTSASAPSEPPQGAQSILDPSQTDHESVAVEKARAAAHVDYPEAPRPQPPNAPSTEPDFGGAVASSEPQAPLAAQVEEAKAKEEPTKEEPTKEETKNKEPRTGEKRDLDSTANPAPAPAPAPAATSAITDDKDHPVPDRTEEPELKKQKLEANPESSLENKEDKHPNATAPATAPVDNSNGDSKKAGRPKKDKVKDAFKKIIPTDGPGSRTRSRTKGD